MGYGAFYVICPRASSQSVTPHAPWSYVSQARRTDPKAMCISNLWI